MAQPARRDHLGALNNIMQVSTTTCLSKMNQSYFQEQKTWAASSASSSYS